MRNLVVVGGGSAGWMTAAYLNRVLDAAEQPYQITVVEAPAIGAIGVGEATIPTILDFFQLLDIPELELMVKTNATIKAAIRFDNWRCAGHSYYHPFEAASFSDGIDIASHWSAQRQRGQAGQNFAEATGVLPALCAAQKVPKSFDAPDYQGPSGYAYHLDAALLGDLLKNLAIKRGVTHVEAKVERAQLDDQGNVASLVTDQGSIDGDFFIDCSGFRSLLIEQALGADYHSYADELLCDSALAVPTEHPDGYALRSCTVATAQSAGWTWEIDLANRRGNGYVYASDFISADQAAAEFAEHLRKSTGRPQRPQDFRELKMRVGRRNQFWVKNCLAVGLAGGFVEPLESTGLQLIDMGLRLFFDHMPGDCADAQPLRDSYNNLMSGLYDEIRDFIVLHYVLTERRDTKFWRHCADEVVWSERLQRLMALWQHKLPSMTDFQKHNMFGAHNYQYVLAGMGELAPKKNHYLAGIDSARSQGLLQEMAAIRQQALNVSPTQSDYITRIRAPFV